LGTTTASKRPAAGQNSPTRAVSFLFYFGCGLAAAALWSIVGCAIALAQGDLKHFLTEWIALQGPFLVGIGVWLVLIARSGALPKLALKLEHQSKFSSAGLRDQRLRWLVVSAIAAAGTASLIEMGLDATGPLLGFMWVTCAAICVAAGYVTLHALNLLIIVHHLDKSGIKVFSYSPARTPELRETINYFTTFTTILCIGYAFAFAATLKGHWTGSQSYIEAVQWFWPLIYVPICSMALVYPHVVLHNLVLRAKEKILSSYQAEIDQLLVNYQGLKADEVQRINNLAQLFDRISGTPDYVIDLGIAFRTALPLAFNLMIIFVKPVLGLT
jgi:hypothetical protein